MSKTYGVWGLGVVGTSVLRYLSAHAISLGLEKLAVLDSRAPTNEEQVLLQAINAHFYPQKDHIPFFELCDYVVPVQESQFPPFFTNHISIN